MVTWKQLAEHILSLPPEQQEQDATAYIVECVDGFYEIKAPAPTHVEEGWHEQEQREMIDEAGMEGKLAIHIGSDSLLMFDEEDDEGEGDDD